MFSLNDILYLILLIILGVVSVLADRGRFRFFTLDGPDDKERRKAALRKAKMFLLQYKDIWKNLTLSNKYCTLKLRADGQTIVGKEKPLNNSVPYRTFTIVASHVHANSDLWNMFCKSFSHQTTYDGLVEYCKIFNTTIYEDIITPPQSSVKQVNSAQQNIVKTDINNCSEIELTALPGISIVISKKIIKKREQIGGFKSVDEFLKFINLKPNITNKLKEMIVVSKMKGSLKVEKYKERTVDL